MFDPSSIKPRFSSLVLVGALGACTNDVVDLGGGQLTQSVEPGPSCGDSGVVEGDVYVENQQQLDALFGCEEIRGDLTIQVFEETDLTPLTELRAVDGNLMIGSYPQLVLASEEAFDAYWEEAEVLDAIVAAGWLPSLAGVESLERVGGLGLSHVSAPSLEAFESLRLMTGSYDALNGGRLSISKAPQLVDLAGLENLRGVRAVELTENPSLVSLDGLVIGRSLDALHLRFDPVLSDIDALSPLQNASTVFFEKTAIANLDALANLSTLWSGSVALSGNPELTQVDALSGLVAVGSLVFENCPKLDHLPELGNLSGLDSLTVVGNDSLKRVPLELPKLAEYQAFFGADPISSGIFEIIGNPQLESLSVGAGFLAAEVLFIQSNAGLTRVDLGSLQRIDQLSIGGNSALTEVAIESLQTVDSLSVIGNPLLSTAELRNVRTFESEFIDNADDPPTP